MDEAEDKIWRIFGPEIARRVDKAREDNARFAHYTSAESGMKILDTGQMLLRSSKLMNDFSEVEYGLNCLSHALNSGLEARLRKIMTDIQVDLPDIFAGNFGPKLHDLMNQTYLFSVSEHDDGIEDELGRLSMWRAYAQKNGVAFVFNSSPFVSETNSLNAFSAPVLYKTPEDFVPILEEVVKGIEDNADFLSQFGGAFFHDTLTRAFRMMAQTTKHPAFEEEKEWRVLYSPTLIPEDEILADQDDRIPPAFMTIRGVPQRVYGIPFKNYPEEGFVGATVPEILERILIGPSADQLPIAHAYFEKLQSKYGIETPLIRMTGIPLRS